MSDILKFRSHKDHFLNRIKIPLFITSDSVVIKKISEDLLQMEYLDLTEIKIQHVKTLIQIFKCLVAIKHLLARITPLHIDLSYIDLVIYSVRSTSICYLTYKLSVIVFCHTFFNTADLC